MAIGSIVTPLSRQLARATLYLLHREKNSYRKDGRIYVVEGI
jgi:hypothetical protein